MVIRTFGCAGVQGRTRIVGRRIPGNGFGHHATTGPGPSAGFRSQCSGYCRGIADHESELGRHPDIKLDGVDRSGSRKRIGTLHFANQ